MKIKQLIEKLEHYIALEEEGELEYELIGVRFEDKKRAIGEILEPSKFNDDREDEREFPEYGSEEYENLPDAGGASAWTLEEVLNGAKGKKQDRLVKDYYMTDHCYIIVGDKEGFNIDHVLDYGEIVIKDAKVLEIIY